jgi:hypothetical protein
MSPATMTNARKVTLPAWNIAQERVCAEDAWEHEGNVAR